MQEIEAQSDVTSVLKEIAEEEIDEVDIIMEDISDEIKDLEESISADFEKEINELPSYNSVTTTEVQDESILRTAINQVSNAL